MRDNPVSTWQIHAVADDGFDAAIRFLTDLQRFGFELSTLSVRSDGTARPCFAIELAVTQNPAIGDLAHRLARHPSVVHVNASRSSPPDALAARIDTR